MEDGIKISYLNDFIFCPLSIYFHNLYDEKDTSVYHSTDQTEGTYAHKSIDSKKYSNRKKILQGVSVYSSQLGLYGKIDLFDIDKGELVERKKKVVKIYDGYIYQLYAQYYSLLEMGYEIKNMKIHSLDDNKNYPILLPSENEEMNDQFIQLINDINDFDMNRFVQINKEKCNRCIYNSSCDRS